MRVFLFPILLATSSFLHAQKLNTKEYKEDFTYFWNTLREDYAYFDKKQTNWNAVKTHYEKGLDTIKSNRDFTFLLEAVFRELYDDHASLNTNTPYSRRLVPSGTDVWAAYVKGKPLILEVRHRFGAEKAGITAGMEVVAINDVAVEQAIAPFLPKTMKNEDPEALNYALRVALAGNHIQPRKLSLKQKDKVTDYFPDTPQMLLENIQYPSLVNSAINNDIGYIKINNSLYNNELIAAFDSIMANMANTKALILDLRETPSGGNTTVARAILGWFVNKDQFYQKHEIPAEERAYGVKRSWIEIVSPRKGKYYGKPLVVLGSHWTGSAGEGITIAFDGLKRATVIGTRLAGLNGAIYSYSMPNTKIGFSFPVEKLYHVDGTPRELYKPTIELDLAAVPALYNQDPALEEAKATIDRKLKITKKK
ncbi:S41 family peptidase [Flavisolibacter tropicus]|uniref:S41 family peptidase n=1 Tax=Flavisolibacter tropicus TaxID=1492898 RepID=UPI00082EB6A8|nr:S41 family peptidase [Flavisolibacter tropicus]